MKYLQTSKRWFLLGAGFFYALLFYTSYSSILFIVMSQILWFYQTNENPRIHRPGSFLIFNGFILLLCVPWIIFCVSNYQGQSFIPLHQPKAILSLLDILYGMFHDWVPHIPLMIASLFLFFVFPFFHRNKRNAFVLITVFIMPISGLYLYCKAFHITHFVSSRYFICFLPFFLITLYSSIQSFEDTIPSFKRLFRLKFLFIILFIASNLIILPLYYRAEKEDFRGLVTFLKANLRPGDRIFDIDMHYTPGILHYFGIYPEERHYRIPYYNISEEEIELRTTFRYQDSFYTIYYARNCCSRYLADGNRLWIVGGEIRRPKD